MIFPPQEFSRDTLSFPSYPLKNTIWNKALPQENRQAWVWFSFVPPTYTTSNVTGDQDLENKATFPDQIANFQTL